MGAPRQTGISTLLLFQALPRIALRASIEWMNDNAPRLGAAVAFYSLLSLAPFLVVAVAVAAVVYGQDASQGRLALQIEGLAGPDVARTIQEIIKSAYQPQAGAIATLFGLATLAFGASSMFVELHDALDTIWGVPDPVDSNHAAAFLRLLRDRFYSFVEVTCIGFLVLAALVLNTWISAMRFAVPRAVTFAVLYLVFAVLFAALYRILPDVALKWSDVAPGAMLTSLLFMLGKHLLALYFAYTSLGSTYAAAGSPIVILLWVYYSAQLFFWGAEFSKVYARTLGSHRAVQ
jgi:membrane protein